MTVRGRAAGVLLLALGLAGCDGSSPAAQRKMLVMGFDGMDPVLVGRMIDEGRLPNLAKLASTGGFVPLGTSVPPQSPVAWSNFITGADAGVHGIFDFIHRERKRDTGLFDPCALYFSTSEGRPGGEPFEVGGYLVPKPWAPPETVLLRDGRPFWEFLDEAGIPVRMYRLPANYPPSKSHRGNMCCLSGMGTPDVMATQGTYQYFSRDTDVPYGGESLGGGKKMRVRYRDGVQSATLVGPKNPFVPGAPETTIELRIFPDATNEVAKIEWTNRSLFGDETVEVLLKAGEWSDWQPLAFETVPWMQPGGVRAMCKLLLKQVHPKIRLYVSPVNFDPRAPAIRLSEPEDFAPRIAEDVGPYATLGFAEAFKALSHRVLTDAEYREQALSVLAENNRLLDHALKEFRGGLLFFYFSSSDLMAHMFWWQGDDKHPVRTPEDARKYNAVIEELYEMLDAALGRAMEAVGDDATVIVLSDHGFNNWGRQLNLNNWLRDEGYLVAQKPDAPWTGIFDNTDWSRTRAYGVGLNGLYLNLKGREKDGIVEPGAQRDALLREISEKLLALKDPQTGRNVVHRVYRAEEVYAGAHVGDAPDLIVGYARNYRVSGESGIGMFEKQTIADNRDAWSADHCVAAELVPGVLLSNRRIVHPRPALVDLAPTILEDFGVTPPLEMKGRGLFRAEAVARGD